MQTVKVRLRKPNRVFTFLCNNIPLKRDEPCIVRSDRGLEFGVCVMPPEEGTEDSQQRFKMSVVRRANHHDLTTFKQILFDEDRVKRSCQEKIKQRDLPMKLVESEYSFVRKKITFYFTADDRVDFRELVKDLAAELKARIELRHIQVRDEAKLVGGLGTCGRELCCTTWLREFMPISMRMAKRQNLSLNPTKISGQCGRLMCCLSYENDLYAKARRGARDATASYLSALRDEMEDDAPRAAKAVRERDEPFERRGEGRTARDTKVHELDVDDYADVPDDSELSDGSEDLDQDVALDGEASEFSSHEATETEKTDASAEGTPVPTSGPRKSRRRRRKKSRGGPRPG